MRHLRFLTLTPALVALVALAATAQPPAPPPGTPAAPAGPGAAAVAYWAAQLVLDTEILRDSMATAGPRWAELNRRANLLHDSALRFYRQARTDPDPDRLRPAFVLLNTDTVALMDTAHAALRTTPNPAVARAVSRVEYTRRS
jgi:hypothetical protein